jgi:predicted nucleic acid-binding protein
MSIGRSRSPAHGSYGPRADAAQVCRDADDDVVLGTAIAGRCDAIVTGDKDLLDLGGYRDIPIVSPRAFWSFESHRRSRA